MRPCCLQKSATTGTTSRAIRHGRLQTSPRRHPHLASMGRSRQAFPASALCSTLPRTGQVARDRGCAAPEVCPSEIISASLELSGTTPSEANIWPYCGRRTHGHVIFDRNWVHPANGAEEAHGSESSTAATRCVITRTSRTECIALTGKMPDATGIGGGSGDEPISTLRFTTILSRPPEKHSVRRSAGHHRSHRHRDSPQSFVPAHALEGGANPATRHRSGNPYIVKNNLS